MSAAIECFDITLDVVVLEAASKVGGQIDQIPHTVRNVALAPDGNEDLVDALARLASLPSDRLQLDQTVTRLDLAAGAELVTGMHRYRARSVLVTTGSRRRELEIWILWHRADQDVRPNDTPHSFSRPYRRNAGPRPRGRARCETLLSARAGVECAVQVEVESPTPAVRHAPDTPHTAAGTANCRTILMTSFLVDHQAATSEPTADDPSSRRSRPASRCLKVAHVGR
ncbi:MAG: hypothetical protein ACYCV7_13800 [Acidimicrobiales bacterium]